MRRKGPSPERAGHPKLVAVLVGLATLLAIVAIFSIWANRQALNTDNWVNTSGKVLQNEDVQAQLSDYVAAQLFAHVDVKAELSKALPPQLQALAAPAAGALSQLAPKLTERALATPQVQALWETANRRAHERLLELLDGGGKVVSTENGKVTLDLGGLIANVANRLGVASGLAAKIPPGTGKLTILESEQISTAQDIAKLIRKLPIVLTLLVLVLYAAAIYLAGPRRRRALRSVGLSLAAAGALVLIVRSIGGHAIVNGLVANEAAKPAVEAVWGIATSLLVTVATSALALGIIVFLAAWLAGPTKLATGIRQESAPYLRDQPGTAFLVVLAVFIALIAWAPVAAFRKPLGVLLFAILFVVGAELLRRQALREFPDAQRGDLGERLRGLLPRRSQPAADPVVSEIDQLERLGALRASGALTAVEFDEAKAQVLRSRANEGGASLR